MARRPRGDPRTRRPGKIIGLRIVKLPGDPEGAPAA